MRTLVFVALIFACTLAIIEQTHAAPSHETTAAPKEVKEPKDIKEAATASKDVKDAIKAAKEAKKNKKDCMKECTADYDPVCVHDPNSKSGPITFGNQCTLDVHNCEMGTKLVVKNKGVCDGNSSLKFS